MKKELLNLLKKHGYKEELIKVDSFNRVNGIVIDNNGKRFFVKGTGNQDTYRYRSLLAEAEVTEILSKICINNNISKNGYRLLVPTFKQKIIEGDYILFLTEYIKANNLLDAQIETQADILLNSISLVAQLDKYVKNPKSVYFKSYTNKALFISTPTKLLKASILNPAFSLYFLRLALKTLPLIWNKSKNKLVHADINMSNILYTKKDIYLTDWEETGMGTDLYNLVAPLSVHWENKVMRQQLLKSMGNKKRLGFALLAIRTLLLFNQKIDQADSRRKRDIKLLEFLVNA